MEKRIAICPGSFDPITKGHLDIIRRAANLFDEVIVLIMVNYTKTNTAFTAAERVEMARRVTADIPNVRVDYYAGLLADYARQQGACTLVKGLRAVTDFEYEFQMALTNKKLYPNLETLFLTTDIQYMYLSSSVVRQVASFGGDISEFVCSEILEDIQKRLAPAPGVLPNA
ncbi:pantetheine-phosphate adenylyltransferase [Candidatus Allofournierella merdipullorum]|uniref:pantetheine-phosphate adenylyltransferase n=1 Tax=Candidatus Allofournierella merdipullorum TaxID=2838595 RepID=UPI002A8A2B7E|nr:pantetheine-phosphate adenylyltransferase [Candidatus Fournierella merdipullorum]